jgi:hypothetical protein
LKSQEGKYTTYYLEFQIPWAKTPIK